MKIKLLALMIVLASCYEAKELPPDEVPWRYGMPHHFGLNNDQLLAIDDSLKNGYYEEIFSLLILKNGRLVYENYYDESFRSELRSIGLGTSVVTLYILGEMVKDGYIASLDSPIYHYLPQYSNVFDAQPVKRQITFRHILNHKHGMGWNEGVRHYADERNDINQMKFTADWAGYVIKQNNDLDPGLRFVINYGAWMLLTSSMQNALGNVSLEEYAAFKFFEPLGITDYEWVSDPTGTLDGATGLFLKDIDYLKIGHLVLSGGRWNTNTIVNEPWMQEMTTIHNITSDYNHGYGWTYMYDSTAADVGLDASDLLFTPHQNGQFLFVIPEEEMVVCVYAENYFDLFWSSTFAYRSPSVRLLFDLLPSPTTTSSTR